MSATLALCIFYEIANRQNDVGPAGPGGDSGGLPQASRVSALAQKMAVETKTPLSGYFISGDVFVVSLATSTPVVLCCSCLLVAAVLCFSSSEYPWLRNHIKWATTWILGRERATR